MGRRKTEPEVIEGFVERNVDTPTSSGASRITIHVQEDGQIDWDKSKAGAADELLAAVTSDPTMLEKIASCPELKDDLESSQVAPAEGGMALDLLTSIESFIFSSVSKKMLGMKIEQKIVHENFALTPEEHERQDPLAAQGLQMALDAMQLDPKYKWAYLLAMAHGASLIRASKQSIMAQFDKNDPTPPNPLTTTTTTEEKK